MNKGFTLIGGISLGAGLMYMMDPHKGKRRRALVRDQLVHTVHKTQDVLEVGTRDLSNRAQGVVAQTGSRLIGKIAKKEVPDEVLVARVRAKMGHVVSSPHLISVIANAGLVTLSGAVRASEYTGLLTCVADVPGVTGIENLLMAYDGSETGTASRERGEEAPSSRTPAARLLMGMAGGALTLYGARRRGIVGTAVGTAGLGMLARGLTNAEIKSLAGVGGAGHAIDIQKTIHIAAPVEQVFEFWTHYANFPRFMPHVREVRDLGEGRSRWVVAGPVGAPIEWDAVITKLVPNQVLAWQSEPGSPVENAGVIHFEPDSHGATRVSIKLTYNPPAGVIGHAVAALLGADPKHEMDQDLVRLKALLELGRTRVHGETVTREELNGGPPERVSEGADS